MQVFNSLLAVLARSWRSGMTILFCCLLLSCAESAPGNSSSQQASGAGGVAPSLIARSDVYGIQLSVIDPPSFREATLLGQFHRWTLAIEHHGQPFSLQAISVDGGMPGHGHGLPTQPRITGQLGEGRYVLEGLKFNMPGRWRLVFDLRSALGEDRVVLEFDVGH